MNLIETYCQGCHKKFKATTDSFGNITQTYHSRHCFILNKKNKKIEENNIIDDRFRINIKDFSLVFNISNEPIKHTRMTNPEKIIFKYLQEKNFIIDIDFFYQYSIKPYFIDFFIPNINTIIEVNGDYWHANPIIYESNDLINYPTGTFKANEIWLKDKIRENYLKNNNNSFNIITIWETDINNKKYIELLEPIFN